MYREIAKRDDDDHFLYLQTNVNIYYTCVYTLHTELIIMMGDVINQFKLSVNFSI